MIAQIVWCVLLFRHPGCFKMRVGKINLVSYPTFNLFMMATFFLSP